MPDRMSDIFHCFDRSPICADGDHECASTEVCSAGLAGCDFKRFCADDLRRCKGPGCKKVFCKADAPQFLDADDRCETCADLLNCPSCGERTDFTIHWTCGYLTCDSCGARTDIEGLRRANEKRAAA